MDGKDPGNEPPNKRRKISKLDPLLEELASDVYRLLGGQEAIGLEGLSGVAM